MTTILVTGIAGFIGSNLAKAALEHRYTVRGLDDFSSGKRCNLQPFQDQITVISASLLDLEAVRHACRGADYVLHHAAIASVPKSMDDPVSSHEANATGTLNLLIGARDAGVQRVIFASSSSVYGNQSSLPAREDSLLDPISLYAVSKLAGELYMRAFTRSFGMETVCLRYFNVFGPNQDPYSPYSGVIARFIEQMLNGNRPTIYGDGEQTRDFTYIDNVVRANLQACEARTEQVNGQSFNVAVGREVSLNEIHFTLQRMTGYDKAPIYADPRRGDIQRSVADISAARSAFNFEPIVDLEEGLRRTVEWYRSASSTLMA